MRERGTVKGEQNMRAVPDSSSHLTRSIALISYEMNGMILSIVLFPLAHAFRKITASRSLDTLVTRSFSSFWKCPRLFSSKSALTAKSEVELNVMTVEKLKKLLLKEGLKVEGDKKELVKRYLQSRPGAFVAASFSDLTVHPVYLGRAAVITHDEDPFCIIDNPLVTMSHPLIALDLKGTIGEILRGAYEQQNERLKCTIAMVRGAGGGKTRALTEIRHGLLEYHPTVLPLLITFSGNWAMDIDRHAWKTVSSIGTKYALSVIARMASVLFGIPFADSLKRLEDKLRVLGDSRRDPFIILEEFILFAVGAVNKARGAGAQEVGTVVVMVDESLIAAREFNSQYGAMFIHVILSDALMSSEIGGLNIAVLLASNHVSAVRSFSCRRGVRAIELPASLPAEEVVTKWWLRESNGETIPVSPRSQALLTFMAATMNSNMRMCEFGNDFVKSLPRGEDGELVFGHTAMKEMMHNTTERVAERVDLSGVNDALLYNITFRKFVELEMDGVSGGIEAGTISNSLLQPFDMSFEPDSSMAIMSAACKKLGSESAVAIRDTIDALIATVAHSTDRNHTQDIFFESWLTLRLKLISLCESDGRFSIPQLFGIGLCDHLDVKYGTSRCEKFPVHVMKSSSYESNDDFADELASLKVSKEHPILLIRGKSTSTYTECFGLAVLIFTGEDTKPLLVLTEHKSIHEDPYDSNSYAEMEAERISPNMGRQYNQVREKLKDKFTPDSTLKYVYFAARDGKAFGRSSFVCRGDTRKFFSVAWEAYQAAINVPDSEDKY